MPSGMLTGRFGTLGRFTFGRFTLGRLLVKLLWKKQTEKEKNTITVTMQMQQKHSGTHKQICKVHSETTVKRPKPKNISERSMNMEGLGVCLFLKQSAIENNNDEQQVAEKKREPGRKRKKRRL